MSLSTRRLKILKEKLQEERERVLDAFNNVSSEEFVLNSDDRQDTIDQATSEYERSQILRFRNRDHYYKKKLDKAIAKFDTEEYGVCEECDDDIKYERLFARPTAELCIGCKDEAEREEQNNITGRQSKSLGTSVTLSAVL